MEPKIVIKLNDYPIDKIKFSSVPVGVTREVQLEVENVGDVEMQELQFDIDNADITIIIAPKKLDVNQKASLVIQYKPEINIDSGVETDLKIKGKYVV